MRCPRGGWVPGARTRGICRFAVSRMRGAGRATSVIFDTEAAWAACSVWAASVSEDQAALVPRADVREVVERFAARCACAHHHVRTQGACRTPTNPQAAPLAAGRRPGPGHACPARSGTPKKSIFRSQSCGRRSTAAGSSCLRPGFAQGRRSCRQAARRTAASPPRRTPCRCAAAAAARCSLVPRPPAFHDPQPDSPAPKPTVAPPASPDHRATRQQTRPLGHLTGPTRCGRSGRRPVG